ncbi:GTP cyclohydrolase II [Chytridiales sp. JEL 0842]|nr:GTP cyclohydrolase II [Chytridiales sp. JEL 0842]
MFMAKDNVELMERISVLGFFGHTLHISTQSLSSASFDSSAATCGVSDGIPNGQQTPNPLTVQCQVKTRIPSEWGGEHHLLLYSNSKDNEEHMAIVYGDDINSISLEEFRPGDTDRERMIRGAKPLSHLNTTDSARRSANEPSSDKDALATHTQLLPQDLNGESSDDQLTSAPLARIHSCCFTGETLGSLRCDCKEQLQEAMKLMGEEGRGVILYLKQEGRGIGLREKLRAYNLIDQGYDTMEANVQLGHPPDARDYEIASAILRDLGISAVRLLTNNPEKLESMKSSGVLVSERVPMMPATWTAFQGTDFSESNMDSDGTETVTTTVTTTTVRRKNSSVPLHDRDEYLVTKIQRMGHILDIPTPLLHAIKNLKK